MSPHKMKIEYFACGESFSNGSLHTSLSPFLPPKVGEHSLEIYVKPHDVLALGSLDICSPEHSAPSLSISY